MKSAPEEAQDARRLDGQLLADLWVFRAAARLGSITAAAQRLNVTQGAVSQRVLRLEARLGTPLFSRHKGRMALTEAGVSLLNAMTQVALILNESVSRIARSAHNAIVVSCVPTVATEWLVPHLPDFYRIYPGIEVFVRAELAPATAERMEDAGIDLIIDYQPHPAPSLHELASLQEYLFPVCSRSCREALEREQAGTVPLALLHDDVPCFGAPAGSEWDLWLRAAGGESLFRPHGARHFNLSHLAYHAAMLNQGIALGRPVTVNRLLTRGELVAAFDIPPLPAASYRLFAAKATEAHSPIHQFATWCQSAMAETQAQTLSLVSPSSEPSATQD
jgi:DNA-binding transcriptional LysR family regulator